MEPPSVREFERALRSAGVPETLVPVTDVASGQDGTIWLRAETIAGQPSSWYVIAPNGDMRAKVTLPGTQKVVAAKGDALVVTEKDSLDVPYIVRYRLLR